jgi:nitroreductase
MDIPVDRWYEAIKSRHSRRKYLKQKIDDDLLKEIIDFADELNNSIKGASSYVAFIGDPEDINYQEKVGYLGEGFILEATAKGLGTCWVAGTFDSEIVSTDLNLTEQEEVLAISPLGYTEEGYSLGEKIMSKLVSSHKRKELAELCQGGFEARWPAWIKSALKSARLAPSAINRQPWRFTVKDDAVIVAVDKLKSKEKISRRLDCGIAMLHLEVGALYEGLTGEWEYLTAPEVARFIRVNLK